jgi:hypothetical protein
VSVFYTIDFFRNVDSKVYINGLVLDGPPSLMVNNKNFLVIVKHVYPETGSLYGMQDSIFNLHFFLKKQIPGKEFPYTNDRNL